MDYDFNLISRLLVEAAVSAFRRENIEFVFFSGSFAYGGATLGKSDIDIAIVVRDDNNIKGSDLMRFSKEYVDIHKTFGFCPDLVFPGEIFTVSNLDDAIKGRGFSIQNGVISLPKASDKYYLLSHENWFRAWLSMITFSVFAFGNKITYEKYKMRGWETVLLFIFHSQQRCFLLDSLVEHFIAGKDKWEGFGLTENYVLFDQYERPHIRYALDSLVKSGFLEKSNDAYLPIEHVLNFWVEDMKEYKASHPKKGVLLFNQKVLSKVSKEIIKYAK